MTKKESDELAAIADCWFHNSETDLLTALRDIHYFLQENGYRQKGRKK